MRTDWDDELEQGYGVGIGTKELSIVGGGSSDIGGHGDGINTETI